jgi:hypothetical protein
MIEVICGLAPVLYWATKQCGGDRIGMGGQGKVCGRAMSGLAKRHVLGRPVKIWLQPIRSNLLATLDPQVRVAGVDRLFVRGTVERVWPGNPGFDPVAPKCRAMSHQRPGVSPGRGGCAGRSCFLTHAFRRAQKFTKANYFDACEKHG